MTTERTNDFDEAQGGTTDDPLRSSSDMTTSATLDDTAAISTGGQEPTASTDDLGTGTSDYATGGAYGATGEGAGASDWTAAGGGTGTGDYGTGGDATAYDAVGGTGGATQGGDRLTDAASGVADRAGSTVDTVASQGMTRAGDTLHEVASAIRQSGEQLRDQQPQIASVVDTAAQQLDKASDYLRQSDLQDILYRVEDVARRQPALFIGGAFVLGLAAARFLKTSSSGGGGGGQGWSTGSSYRDLGYGAGATGYGGGTGYGGTAGYGTTGGYSSRTTDLTGTGDYTAGETGYGSRR